MLDSGFPSEGLVDLLKGDIETKQQEENEELVRFKEQEDAIALSQEQAEDETLHKLWQETEDTSEYVVIDKVLHRQTMDQLGAPLFQSVVPTCRRLQVLRLAHIANGQTRWISKNEVQNTEIIFLAGNWQRCHVLLCSLRTLPKDGEDNTFPYSSRQDSS